MMNCSSWSPARPDLLGLISATACSRTVWPFDHRRQPPDGPAAKHRPSGWSAWIPLDRTRRRRTPGALRSPGWHLPSGIASQSATTRAIPSRLSGWGPKVRARCWSWPENPAPGSCSLRRRSATAILWSIPRPRPIGQCQLVAPVLLDKSKRFAEAITTMAYHREYGVESRIARIFNTYGPRMKLNDGRIVPAFLFQALNGQPMTVFGSGRQTRSFCFVTDLVDGLVRLAASGEPYPVNWGTLWN